MSVVSGWAKTGAGAMKTIAKSEKSRTARFMARLTRRMRGVGDSSEMIPETDCAARAMRLSVELIARPIDARQAHCKDR